MLYHGHESSSDSVEAYRPHPPMLYRNPRGPPLTVATHKGWEFAPRGLFSRDVSSLGGRVCLGSRVDADRGAAVKFLPGLPAL